MLEFPLLLVFPALMVFAGSMDLLTMTISNRISLALLGGFVVMAPLAGFSFDATLMHLAAGALVLLATIAMFSAGWLGGGDAKLLASSALWVGMEHLVTYLAYVSILGGALALMILVYRRLPLAALPGPDWALRLHRSGSGIPYGLAISGAALWIYPVTPWFSAFAG